MAESHGWSLRSMGATSHCRRSPPVEARACLDLTGTVRIIHRGERRETQRNGFLCVSLRSPRSITRSRRRGRQDFFILGRVGVATEAGRHQQQVLSHFLARETLTEL